jgi:hypothetical protein
VQCGPPGVTARPKSPGFLILFQQESPQAGD